MAYISVKKAADTWGVTAPMVLHHCINGRIKRTQKLANVRLIPKDTPYPEDRRKRNGRKHSSTKRAKT